MSIYREKIEIVSKAVESILNQTYKNFELIIVLDSPEYKEMIDFIKSLEKKDKRIFFYVNKKNLGDAYSKNFSINKSKGKYIAIMDCDDIALKNRFEKQIKFMRENKDCDLCYGNVIHINKNDKIQRNYNLQKNLFNKLYKKVLGSYMIPHPTVFAKRKIFNNIKYDIKFRKAKDFDVLLRLNKKFKFMKINEVLVKYRVSDSKDLENRFRKAKNSTKWSSKALLKNYKLYWYNLYYNLMLIDSILKIFILTVIPKKILIKILKNKKNL